MPGIIGASPGGVQPGQSGDVEFANEVAQQTGLDPRVVFAWEKAEGDPGDLPGYYNYLNVATPTAVSLGVTPIGTGPANTAKFGTLAPGVKATVLEILSPAIGLSNEKGKTPAQQIADIAATPWASSHYGGPGGPNLLRDFENLYGKGSAGTASNTPLPGGGGGASGDQTKLGNPLGFLTGWVGDIFHILKVYALRVAEVVGGVLVALAGAFMLSGRGVPTPLGALG